MQSLLSGAFTLASAKAVDALARRLLRARPQLAGTAELADRRSLPVLAFVFTSDVGRGSGR